MHGSHYNLGVECLVIADDLTGACDAAVQFAVRGRATSVLLTPDSATPGIAVAAVSTDSRHAEEAEVPALIAAVAAMYGAPVCVFKKIDSTLRGNPAAEIAAAMEAFAFDAAVATPAFPAQGRLVRGGRLNPGDLDVAGALRSDVHVAPDGVGQALAGGARVVSADAANDADLDCIAAAAVSSGRRILWAGSAGLAAALARCGGEVKEAPMPGAAAVVFCIGSEHAVTKKQIERLREALPGSPVVFVNAIPPDLQALLLCGGETAAYVCREAGVQRIDLCGEILPGIPWGYLRGGTYDGIPVVTKSGGFGAEDALIRVAEFFQ
jgi:D-threonate/D-erythronate kinase